jgi:hypothetical protein
LRERTRDLIEQHWHLIEVLAGELVRHQELNQAQMEAILARAAPMPRPARCLSEARAASG